MKNKLQNLLFIFFKNIIFFILFPQIVFSLQAFSQNAAGYKKEDGKTTVNLALPLTKVWDYRDKENIEKIFASDNALEFSLESLDFFLTFPNGRLDFIDISTKQLIWSSELGGDIVSNVLANKDSVFVVTANKDKHILKKLDKTTGITKWQKAFDISDGIEKENELAISYLKLFSNNVLFINPAGQYFAISQENGDLVWSLKNPVKLSASPVFSKDKLISGTTDNKINVIAIENGEYIYRLSINNTATALASTEDNELILGCKNGLIFLINPANNIKRWTNRFGAEIIDIVPTRFGLLISSMDNFVRLVSITSGRQIWKKRLSGRLSVKPLVSDDFGVFTLATEPEADVIELKSGKIINRILLSDGDFFTGDIFLNEKLLIFSTLDGLIGFSHKNLALLPAENPKNTEKAKSH